MSPATTPKLSPSATRTHVSSERGMDIASGERSLSVPPLALSRKLSARLDALEATLSSARVPHPVRGEQRISPSQQEVVRRLVATAAIHVDKGKLENARQGRIDSPTLITRALLSFGGEVGAYDKAVTHALFTNFLDNAPGHTRRVYVMNSDLRKALRDGILDSPEAASRWPNLARISSLRAQVESREIEQALREPTSEQVARTVSSISSAMDGSPLLQASLAHLLKLAILTPHSDPSFARSELLSDGKSHATRSREAAQRAVLRLGITCHRDGNAKSGEYLTELGRQVLDDSRIFDRLMTDIPEAQTGGVADVEPSIANFGPRQDEMFELPAEPVLAPQESHPIVEEPSWQDPLVTLSRITGLAESDVDMRPFRAAEIDEQELASRLAGLCATRKGQNAEWSDVVTVVSSPTFWEDLSRSRAIGYRRFEEGESGAPTSTQCRGFDKLEAEIREIVAEFSTRSPQFKDAESISYIIVKGFTFYGHLLVGSPGRPEDEILRPIRKGDSDPKVRDRMDAAFRALKTAGCVEQFRSGHKAAKLALNPKHELIARVISKLNELRGEG